MIKMRPKNWGEFQHYRDRDPPWIKLHRRLLDDRAFHALPIASIAIAQFLWLLASGNKDGWFDGDPVEVAYRLRWPIKTVQNAITPLVQSGFFVVEHDASAAIAGGLQGATTETEGETQVKAEADQNSAPDRFNEFWLAYPKKVDRGGAIKAWQRAIQKADAGVIIAGAQAYAAEREGEDKKFTKQPETWLNKESWANSQPIEMPADMTPERLAELQDRTDRNLKRGKYAEKYA